MPINLDAPTPYAIPRLGGSNPLQARLIWKLPLPNPIGGSHPSAPQIWKIATQVCPQVIPARFEAGFAGPSPGAPGKPPRPSVGFPGTGGPGQIQTSPVCLALFVLASALASPAGPLSGLGTRHSTYGSCKHEDCTYLSEACCCCSLHPKSTRRLDVGRQRCGFPRYKVLSLARLSRFTYYIRIL